MDYNEDRGDNKIIIWILTAAISAAVLAFMVFIYKALEWIG